MSLYRAEGICGWPELRILRWEPFLYRPGDPTCNHKGPCQGDTRSEAEGTHVMTGAGVRGFQDGVTDQAVQEAPTLRRPATGSVLEPVRKGQPGPLALPSGPAAHLQDCRELTAVTLSWACGRPSAAAGD